MKTYFIALIFLLPLAVLAGCSFQNAQTASQISDNSASAQQSVQPPLQSKQQVSVNIEKPPVVIDMIARQWEFDPSTITVKKGDRVLLHITSEDVTHGFAIDEFGINTQLISGKETTVEFVADKAGVYDFYCSVYCGSGHGGMRGRLVVE